jgi:hypothetical protein
VIHHGDTETRRRAKREEREEKSKRQEKRPKAEREKSQRQGEKEPKQGWRLLVWLQIWLGFLGVSVSPW